MKNTEKNKIVFPYEINPINSKDNDEIKESFKGERSGYVQIGPKHYKMSQKYAQFAEAIYNFKVRSDDVWVVTLPRAGTCLISEIAWLIHNDLNFEYALNTELIKRVPMLEFSTVVHDEIISDVLKENYDNQEKCTAFLETVAPVWENLAKFPGKRVIKTHLPYSLLPPDIFSSGCKVIYVARNPKDVAVSYFKHSSNLRSRHFVKDFEAYWNLFQKDLVCFTPFWEHVQEGWDNRNRKNFVFLFFEDIVKDYRKAIIQVSELLEKHMTKEEIDQLAEHMKFENIQKNKSINRNYFDFLSLNKAYNYIRAGKDGAWRLDFTEELSREADKWIEEHYGKTDCRFPTNLK